MTQYGNCTLAQIIKMKIDTIGIDVFCDVNFAAVETDKRDWKQVLAQIEHEENMTENSALVDERISAILEVFIEKIFSSKDKYFSMGSINYKGIFIKFSDFFYELKQNITSAFPGDIPTAKIVEQTFLWFVKRSVPAAENLRDSTYVSHIELNTFINFFCKKNPDSSYELTFEKANKLIFKAFENAEKSVTILEDLLSNHGTRCINTPVISWNILQQILDEKNSIFEHILYESIVTFKNLLCIYFLMQNFSAALQDFIPKNWYSTLIDPILNYLEHVSKNTNAVEDETKRVHPEMPRSAIEYCIYEFNFAKPYDFPDYEFFYYDMENKDLIKTTMESYTKRILIEKMLQRPRRFNPKFLKAKMHYVYNQEKERYFFETFCTKEFLGNSAEFYYNWFLGRLENSSITNTNYNAALRKSAQHFWTAFNKGRYFAGNNLRLFLHNAVICCFADYAESKQEKERCETLKAQIKKLFDWAKALNIQFFEKMILSIKEIVEAENINNEDPSETLLNALRIDKH